MGPNCNRITPFPPVSPRISWFKRQSLTFMILKHRFNSFRDPWMGRIFGPQLSMRAAHARLSNGCAGLGVRCAPIRADYVVVSPHKYRRMRRLYAIGPLGPTARWVRIPCRLMASAIAGWLCQPLWLPGPSRGPYAINDFSLRSPGGSRPTGFPPDPPFDTSHRLEASDERSESLLVATGVGGRLKA